MMRDELREFYRRAVDVALPDVPAGDPASHTMGSALDAYAVQRVPADVLDLALAAGVTVEVHGVYPEHVVAVEPTARLVHPGHWFGPAKSFNVVRPRFFALPADPRSARPLGTGDRLVVAVPPGRDYVLHIASIVRHYLRARGLPACRLRRVVRYPDAEGAIARWTGLDRFVGAGDRVLMGYVKELLPHLLAGGGTVTGKDGNEFYGAVRVAMPGGERLCLLGVRFSFWGCISARLVEACARAGVTEIVYAGKLGTLTDPGDIYRRLFLPSAYVDAGGSPGVLGVGDAPYNGLLARYGELGTGPHMSVATVLEEDIAQRAVADRLGVRSIDNEIAQMATAICRAGRSGSVTFSALHFATDYLRRPGEPEPRGVYNLTNHRRQDALARKRQVLERIAVLLRDYYGAGPVVVPRPAAGRTTDLIDASTAMG